MRARLSGLTLIELLLSVLCINLLCSAILAAYLHCAKEYHSTRVKLQLQTESAFAMMTLERFIQLAGYRNLPDVGLMKPTNKTFYQPVIATQQTAYNSQITVHYTGDDQGILDCLNRPVPQTVMAENTFFIDESHRLKCKTQWHGASPLKPLTATLIHHVKRFRAQFYATPYPHVKLSLHLTSKGHNHSVSHLVRLRQPYVV